MAEQNAHDGGLAIKTLRGLAGLTLKQVAVGADTSISYLSKVENGTLVPQKRYVAKVAAFISENLATAEATSTETSAALAAERRRSA